VNGPRDPVELWCVDLSAATNALLAVEARNPRLGDDELERAATLSDPNVRAEWQAAHIALRLLLERAWGSNARRVAFAREERGRPYLAGAPFAFSLSHAPGVALIGISTDGVIGVDIERPRAVRIDPARRARIRAAGSSITPAALSGDEDTSFLQAWVRLEALAKAEGCGIGRLLTRLGIMGEAARGPVTEEEMRARARALLGDSPVAAVHDLQLGEGVFAAVASSAAPAGPVNCLPHSLERLEMLLN
jgi:4'-phosphopantetheinyl transferase